jgi:uncharacterized membrane protein
MKNMGKKYIDGTRDNKVSSTIEIEKYMDRYFGIRELRWKIRVMNACCWIFMLLTVCLFILFLSVYDAFTLKILAFILIFMLFSFSWMCGEYDKKGMELECMEEEKNEAK